MQRKSVLDLLWADASTAAPAPRPALTLDALVRAGIEIADAGGLAELTMGRVARELGVTTMALYRHVPGKEELIELVIDRALGTPPSPRGRTPRTRLASWARSELELFQRRPWLVESATRRLFVGPNWAAWLESALAALAGLDLTPKQRLSIVFLADGHVRSAAQIMLGMTGSAEWRANFEAALGRAIATEDERFPVLRSIVLAGGFDEPSRGEDDTFEFGLQRLLDGIDAFSARRAARSR